MGGQWQPLPFHSDGRGCTGAGVAMTWHTSTWLTWEGQPVPGQDSFSGLSCLQIMWICLWKNSVEKKSEKYDRLALEGWRLAAKLAVINT